MATINASDNPSLVNAAVARMLEDDDTAPIPAVVPTELPDTIVTLSAGHITPTGEVVREAEVRELNGEDEEHISKAVGTGKFLTAVLQRGVVRVGDERPTASLLDSLLSGDRDDLLLGIRRATFGPTATFRATCPHCGEEQDVEVDLRADVPTRTMADPADRVFEVECRAGTAEVCLPTGAVQRKVLDSTDKTVAELNTALLEGCVREIDGIPVMGPASVRRLGIRDRERIIEEITDRITGPRLSEVTKGCPSCEGEMALPLSMMALFRR